jgi:hypothetical protein
VASGKISKEEIEQKQLAELLYDELQKVLQERLDKIADNGKRQIEVPSLQKEIFPRNTMTGIEHNGSTGQVQDRVCLDGILD